MSHISSLFHPDQIEFSVVPPTISHSTERNCLKHDDLFQLVDFNNSNPISEVWTLRISENISTLPTFSSSGSSEGSETVKVRNSNNETNSFFGWLKGSGGGKQDSLNNVNTQIPQAPQTIVKFHKQKLTTAVIYDKTLQIYLKPFDSVPLHKFNIEGLTSIDWVPLTNDTLLVGTQSGPQLYTRLLTNTPLVIPLVYPQHNNIQDLAINRQGSLAATVSKNSPYLIIWDLINQYPQPLLMNEKPQFIKWSPNGRYLAIAYFDKITILDPATFETYPINTDVVHCLAWSPDNQSLIYSSPKAINLKIIQILPIGSHIQLTQLTSIALEDIPNYKAPMATLYNIESISINSKGDLALGYSGKSSHYPNIHLFKINLDYINYYSTIKNQIIEFVRELDYDPISTSEEEDGIEFIGTSNFFSKAGFHPTIDNELWVQYGDRTLKRFSL
ncbi:hypothetical protein CONCODRAFT_76524 [Conidiobolus coronatus NRRL 28638]|uniref:WD40 repeat-like protein n=1 Tax=Conidiobolus coronatus (strain ATCC 28846 / CBS 209.66 / NRRL 28638) TaxID=796925 RepID=A0A137PJ18_CONC2|nr:hypothetical protein CONCODRAFT_76524 [Conidiobolus coronatus NRRL 28638]|eukprot:KXN74992.1 hypothetical protein CONCODRAFT_76524 [Conidiobolus coronatus NRRL 28638]